MMMKIINRIGLALMIFSVIVFCIYYYKGVKNKDAEGPVINIDSGLIEVSIHDNESALLQGVTAFDSKDGDVSSSIGIENISGFIAENTCQIDYVAFDSDNHVSKASRRMRYTDYTTPVFFLDAPLRFPLATRTIDVLGSVHAEDCIDGDISNQIVFSEDSMIYVDVASNYSVTLSVTNSLGDTQMLPVTVTVYDNAAEYRNPKIKLNNYLIYVSQGETIDYKQYIKGITYYGVDYVATDSAGTYGLDTSKMSAEERAKISEAEPTVNKGLFLISNQANTSVPGVYEVEYILDGREAERGSVKLVVIVKGE